MGALPIQSDTQSTSEWIEDGRNGILVHSSNPDEIETALRRALQDDDLIDRAAEANRELVRERLDIATVKPKVINMYRDVASRGPRNGA